MIDIHPWILIVTAAIEMARKLGHEPPGVDTLESAWSELNAAAGKLLPAEVTALTFLARRNAVAVVGAIESMPEDPACPKCGNVLTRSVLHSPHTGVTEAVSSKCGKCGWKS